MASTDKVRALDRVLVVLGAVVYALLFDRIYELDLAPSYEYMGMEMRPIGLDVRLMLLAISAAPAWWLPIRLERPSVVAYWTLYLCVFVPSVLVPVYAGYSLPGGPLTVVLVLTLMVLALGAVYAVRPPTVPAPGAANRASTFNVAFAVFAFALYALVVGAFGFKFGVPSLEEVYDVREDYKDRLGSAGSFVAYAVPWIGNVVNPLLLVLGLTRRQPGFVVASVTGQVMLYSMSGFKTILSSSLLVVAVLIAMRGGRRQFGLRVIWGAALVIALAMIETRAFDTNYLAAVVVRRMIAAPGALTGMYMEFFSVNPHAQLGHSFLGGLVSSPYEISPAELIGQEYFRGGAIMANANFWADGYANFGYVGVVLVTLGLGLILWTYDGIAARSDLRVTTVLLAMPAIAVSNTALVTTFVSHGLGLALLIAYFLPSEEGAAAPRSRRAERGPGPPSPREGIP